MQRFAIFVAFLCFSLSVAAQSIDETHKRIQDLEAERNYSAAAVELAKLKAAQPLIFEANNYDYLAARMSEKSGDTAAALAYYQSVINRDSILKEYALWHVSKIARASGNLLLERIRLEELLVYSPDSLFAGAARQELAESWFAGGDLARAAALFEQQISTAKTPAGQANSQSSRKNIAMLADAKLALGETAKARELYARLIAETLNPGQPDDYALSGALGLDKLDAAGAGGQELSDYEHLQRASIYQFNRDFKNAQTHYEAILTKYPESGIAPDAIFQIGRGFAQRADYVEAVQWFERVLERYPDHPVAKDALLQAASSYARVAKEREAITRYRRYIELYPDDPRVDRAYLNIVDILRDHREESQAIKWANEAKAVFRGKLPEALAQFAEARIYLSRGDWEKGLDALEKLKTLPELGGASVPGGTTLAEVTFLRGFVLENLRRFPEAIDAYLSIPDGRNEYYGWRATERLRSMAAAEPSRAAINERAKALFPQRTKDPESRRKDLQSAIRLTDDPASRQKLLDELKDLYETLPAYRSPKIFNFVKTGRLKVRDTKPPAESRDRRSRADELLFLGLFDEAGPEIEASLGSGTAAQIDYPLAEIYRKGERADKAYAFISKAWRPPADYQIELIPREAVLLMYPAPFTDPLIRHAAPRNLDPRFLLSIMKQESGFRPEIKSYAAARGLMQFISTTSDRIAAQLGRKNFQQDDLYDPPTAVLFGSYYVADLFKLFPNQPQAVAASYNGGEDNMKRWLVRSRSELPDLYVPEIAFGQSKDYVYRVMANYRVYSMFYEQGLKQK